MTPIRIVVWGCGRIARMFHLRELAGNRRAIVVGVADTNADNLAAASSTVPDARTFSDYRETLDLEADAVVVCLPPRLHASAAIAAFEAGYAVYLEKPLALDPVEGARVVEAWRASGRIGVMGFNFRFHPGHAELRARLVEAGELRAVQTRFTSRARTLPEWKRTRAGGGGVLRDLGSHHVDLARHLLGTEIRRVSAFEQSREAEADNAVLLAEFESGVTLQSLLSMNSIQSHTWDVLGRDGRLGVDLSRPLHLDVQTASWSRARLKRLVDRVRALSPRELALSPGWEPSFGRSLEAFVTSVAENDPHPDAATIADGQATLRVIAAAEESARTGRSVDTG